ncbi:MAG TPA: hypothetical protein PKA44_12220, partial [Saprospiraceae bacterium]|nr:hypothetical protein [Saprospiraceae bacterium]
FSKSRRDDIITNQEKMYLRKKTGTYRRNNYFNPFWIPLSVIEPKFRIYQMRKLSLTDCTKEINVMMKKIANRYLYFYKAK